MFGRRFASMKCELLLRDWITSNPNFVLGVEQRGKVDKFSYLDSCSLSGGQNSDEVPPRVQKGRLASVVSVWHLIVDQTPDMRNSTEVDISLRLRTMAVEIRRYRKTIVFENRYLSSISRIGWESLVPNPEVRRKVLGSTVQPLEKALNHNWVKWLGHLLGIPTEKLPRCTTLMGILAELNWRGNLG